jgi:hypothetical protein
MYQLGELAPAAGPLAREAIDVHRGEEV